MSSSPLGLSSHQKKASLRVRFVTGNYWVPPIWCHILSSGSIKSYSISGKRIRRQRQMLNFVWTRGTSTIEMTSHCNLSSEIQFLTQSPWSCNEFLASSLVLLRQFVNFQLQLWSRHGQGGGSAALWAHSCLLFIVSNNIRNFEFLSSLKMKTTNKIPGAKFPNKYTHSGITVSKNRIFYKLHVHQNSW